MRRYIQPAAGVVYFRVHCYSSAGADVTGVTSASAGLTAVLTATDRSQVSYSGANLEAMAGTVAVPTAPTTGKCGIGEVGNGEYVLTVNYAQSKTDVAGMASIRIADTAGNYWTPGVVDTGAQGNVPDTQKVDVNTIKTNPVVNAGTYTFPVNATGASTTNITGGTITTVTNLTNLPTIPANWITAAGINAAALNGKGDWSTLTQTQVSGGAYAMNSPQYIADLKTKLNAIPPRLAVFLAALQNAATTQVPIVIIGDSIGEGYAATDQRNTGWAYKLKTALQAIYGNGGLGFLGGHRSDLYTFAGSWTPYTTFGPDDSYSTNASSIVTLSAQTCSSFQVIVSSVTTFDASVDGGAYQTYSTAAFGTSIHRMGTVACGSLGSHTLAIRGPSSGNLHFFGVVPVIGTSGVVVHNFAITGTAAPNWTGTRVALCPGLAPKLWIISLGINDAGLIDALNASEPDVATFTTYYQSIVTQALASGASVLLMNEQPTYRTGTGSSDAVQAAVLAMANSNGVAYVNITDLWPSYTIAAAAGLMADTLHPNNAGHLLISQQMLASMIVNTDLLRTNAADSPNVVAEQALLALNLDAKVSTRSAPAIAQTITPPADMATATNQGTLAAAIAAVPSGILAAPENKLSTDATGKVTTSNPSAAISKIIVTEGGQVSVE